LTVSVVDLFCGVGGLTRGLLDAGLNVKAGFDLDPTCKYAYEHNNGATFVQSDISKLNIEDVQKYYSNADIKIMVGCAPCQPFSCYTSKNKSKEKNSKWNLLKQYGRLIEEIKPDIVSMENVPNLDGTEPFDNFINILKNNGYRYSYSVIHCEEYGIPQSRRRLVLLASKFGPIYIESPDNFEPVTVRDAIGKLPKISDGEICQSDPLHCCQKLSDINIKRIKYSSPGSTWRDWPENLILECHKKTSGETYSSVYGRMSWEKPSPTITTQFFNYGSGRFGHPEQNRALSLREGALIQTFPEEYEFAPNDKITSIRNTAIHIGNAVPVKLGYVIGKSITKHLSEMKVNYDR